MRKLLLLFFYYTAMTAQVGIGTTTPHSDAMLEVVSTNKGILLPRVSLVSTAVATPLSSHTQGIIVFNTAQSGTGVSMVYPGLYFNDGSSWIRFTPNTITIGEIKHSFATVDHNGWFLLDGRPISSLSAIHQSRATALGYGSNLPNGVDLFLKGKTGSETVGTTGGNDSFTIAQSHLPNVNFIGTTNALGAHSHSVDCYAGDENIGLLSTNALTVFVTEAVAKDGMTTVTRTSAASGDHTHNVSFNSGGSGVPVDNVPKYIATNIFIYLGN
ncbi:hypothetical protein [Flavobacterium sp. GCM10023249]|uniref:hypothetical protein n=1 Tax=unclassified Flavobacterium TaxID=196869 RepID=UPI00361DBD40